MRDWSSYYALIKKKREDPTFEVIPQIPHYKHKTAGREIAIFDCQSFSIKDLRHGYIKLGGTSIRFKTEQSKVKEVHLVPRKGYFIINVIYEKKEVDLKLNKGNILSIDLGVNNLATLTSNISEFVPLIVNGRLLKAYNQYYNKTKATFQSALNKKVKTSNRIERLSLKRNNRIDDFMHKASRFIVDLCVKNDIGSIVIGKNDGWKQNVNIGRVNNQNFVNIPFNKLIHMISYKSKLVGITVQTICESHTSKCSFFDNETIGHHSHYAGSRIARGLFRTRGNRLINADVNASYNILKRYFGDVCLKSFGDGCYELKAFSVKPVMVRYHFDKGMVTSDHKTGTWNKILCFL
jgi:IS605 OrfB family transposase